MPEPLDVGPEFDEGYDATFRRLANIFKSRGFAPDDAADFAQEAVTRILQHLKRHGRAEDDLRPLMNTIAKNLIVERFRSGGREIAIDIDDSVLRDHKDLLQDTVRRDESAALRQALSDLPTAQQQAAMRMWLYGLKPAEIAAELGIKRNAADALLHRARRALAARLEEAREVMCMRGDLSEAVELIDHGLALAKDDGERLQLLIEKARYLGEVGNFDEAAALLDRCEGLNDDHDRAKEIAIERAKIAMSWDDLDAAHRYVQGLGDVRSLPEPAGYEGASLIAGLAATEGRLADAATWAAVAQELADESGRASRQLTARRHTALVLLFSGRVREAQELTRHVFDRYVELGYRKGIIETGVNLLYTSRWTGDLLEARACGERVMETKPDPLWGATALTNISEIEYELGNIEAAEELALRAIEMPESSLTWARVSAHLQLARFALSRGDASTAREHANAGRGTPALAEHSLRAETMLMEAAILADRPSEAREHWTSAQALVTDVSPVLRADEERRLILASDLSVDEMTTALEGLLTRVQDAGLRLEEARTLLSLGVLIAPLRERYFADAEKLFSDTACARGLEELAAMSS